MAGAAERPKAPEPDRQDTPGLLPARMLNEFSYCPRLFFLEWVQGDFRDNPDTIEGRITHRRVDKEKGKVPVAEELSPEDKLHARSVYLSAPKVGLVAKIDLLEAEDGKVVPADYKKGDLPDNPEQSWEPERVQVCAQGLILRENGYQCDSGVIYYAGSKVKVKIPLADELVARTLELRDLARQTAAAGVIPPPLVDSPKCPRCSLVSICLPDETNALRGKEEAEVDVRRLVPARDDAAPLYVQEQGMTVAKRGENLEVRMGKNTVQRAHLLQTSQVCTYGNVSVTPQALHALCERGIPVCHFSYGGWFYGITHGMPHKNIELRRRQYRVADDPRAAAAIARRFVEGKIRNQRTMLRRNHAACPQVALDEMARLADLASVGGPVEALIGIEGAAAQHYFANFAGMLKEKAAAFDFQQRNRRPPTDPVNALLSYLYSVLSKDLTVTLTAVGFDPYLGFLHQPRYGRPALALDAMEEFRSLVCDSVAIQVLNTEEVKEDDFVSRAGATGLSPEARKTVLRAYERRMDSLVTHPGFGYTISYRRVLEVQARLLARHLAGEIPDYPPFTTR